MGEKANQLQRLLDSAYEAEDELLDENTALRRQLHEYKETVEVLEDLCAEIYQGWQQTCVAADGMLQAIARKWDEYGFAIVEPGSVYVEILADTLYAKPEDVEPTEEGTELDASFDGHVEAGIPFVVSPEFFDEFFSDDWDDSHAFAWSPDFDVDGADAPDAGLELDFDLEED